MSDSRRSPKIEVSRPHENQTRSWSRFKEWLDVLVATGKVAQAVRMIFRNVGTY